MREIKFRAWHKTSGAYVYFSPEKMKQDIYIAEHFFTLMQGKHKEGRLEQYTGLKDKNGVEIYEGDLVKDDESVFQVVYQAPKFVMKGSPSHKTWYEFVYGPDENQYQEVIGNMHETQGVEA